VGEAFSPPLSQSDVITNVNITWAPGTAFTATFTRPNILGSTYYNIVDGKSSGVIYAYGLWQSPDRLTKHSDSSAGSMKIDFATGATASTGKTTYFYLVAVGLLIGYIMTLTLCALFVPACHNNTRSMQSLVVLGFLGVLAAWIYLNYLDYKHENDSVPQFRAAGMGIVMCFTIQILPALLRMTPFAFERTVLYHAMSGVALWITMTVHLVGMWSQFTLQFILDTPQLRYGFVSYCLVTALVLLSVFGKRFSYEAFQYTHIPLAIASYSMAILHYPALLKWASVAIVLFAADIVAHFFRFYKCKILTVERMGTFTAITFERPVEFSGGQFAYFMFPGVSMLQMDPFTVTPGSPRRPCLSSTM